MNLMKRQAHEAQRDARLDVTPASYVAEQEDAFMLTLELPGASEQAIELTVEDRTLTVNAENDLPSHKERTLVFSEIPAVRYRASFELPERVNPAGIKATRRNGLLILTLPKREESKPRRIAIAAG